MSPPHSLSLLLRSHSPLSLEPLTGKAFSFSTAPTSTKMPFWNRKKDEWEKTKEAEMAKDSDDFEPCDTRMDKQWVSRFFTLDSVLLFSLNSHIWALRLSPIAPSQYCTQISIYSWEKTRLVVGRAGSLCRQSLLFLLSVSLFS